MRPSIRPRYKNEQVFLFRLSSSFEDNEILTIIITNLFHAQTFRILRILRGIIFTRNSFHIQQKAYWNKK